MTDEKLPVYVRQRPAFDAGKANNSLIPNGAEYKYLETNSSFSGAMDKIAQVDAVQKILLMRYRDSAYNTQALQRSAEKILEIYDIKVLQKLEQQDIKFNMSGNLDFDGFLWLKNSCDQVFADYFAAGSEKEELKAEQLSNAYRLLSTIKIKKRKKAE